MFIERSGIQNSYESFNILALATFKIDDELTPQNTGIEKEFTYQYKYLHKNITSTFNNYKDSNNVNAQLHVLKKLIKECHALDFDAKNEFNDYTSKDKKIIMEKCNKFFNFFKQLNKEEMQLLQYEKDELASAFLVLMGVRPACVINNRLANVLSKFCTEFDNHLCIEKTNDNKHLVDNEDFSLLFSVDQIKKVFSSNKDVFPIVNSTEELISYLSQNPVRMTCNVYGEIDRADTYMGHLSSGLILGLPKAEVIKFAAFDQFLRDYYTKLKNVSLEPDEVFSTINDRPKRYDILKNKRLEYINNQNQIVIERRKEEALNNDENPTVFTVGLVPNEAIDILAESHTEYLDGTTYMRFDNDQVNENFSNLIKDTFRYTDFNEKLRSALR